MIDYESALKAQEALVEQVSETESPGVIVFCQHPAVVTLGRSTKQGDITNWQGPLLEVSRGGRATYHGPSQLVIYPIINLNLSSPHRPAKDVTAYLRNLENAIVQTLQEYGVQAQGRSLQKKSKDTEAGDETGVWIADKKIASLGIAVRRWVTYHGAAVNLHADPSAFQGLRPCGFEPDVMTNLETQIHCQVSKTEFQNSLLKKLIESL